MPTYPDSQIAPGSLTFLVKIARYNFKGDITRVLRVLRLASLKFTYSNNYYVLEYTRTGVIAAPPPSLSRFFPFICFLFLTRRFVSTYEQGIGRRSSAARPTSKSAYRAERPSGVKSVLSARADQTMRRKQFNAGEYFGRFRAGDTSHMVPRSRVCTVCKLDLGFIRLRIQFAPRITLSPLPPPNSARALSALIS